MIRNLCQSHVLIAEISLGTRFVKESKKEVKQDGVGFSLRIKKQKKMREEKSSDLHLRLGIVVEPVGAPLTLGHAYAVHFPFDVPTGSSGGRALPAIVERRQYL